MGLALAASVVQPAQEAAAVGVPAATSASVTPHVLSAPVPYVLSARSLTVTPAHPILREVVRITSTVPGGQRRVILQRLVGTSWVTHSAATSLATGRVNVGTRFVATSRVRLFAPRVGTRAAYVSAPVMVGLVGQRGVITTEPTVFIGEATQVVAAFVPARLDRVVQLEQRTPAGWIAIALAREDSRGRVTFSLVGQVTGSQLFRAIALGRAGASAVTTAAAGMRVLPSTITVSPHVRQLTDEQIALLTSATAPDGSVLVFAASASQPTLVADDLLSLLPTTVLPKGALVRVVSTNVNPDGSLAVTTAPANLPDLVENVPPGFDSFPVTAVSTDVGSLPEGVTLLGPVSDGTATAGSAAQTRNARAGSAVIAPRAAVGVRVFSLPQVRMSFAREVTVGQDKYAVSGHVYVRPGVEAGYHARLGQPDDWKVGVVADYDVGVDASASTALVDTTYKVPLPEIRRLLLVMVGPVPVVFDVRVGPEVSLHLEANVGLETSASIVSDRRVGVERVDGRYRGYTAGGETPDVQEPRPFAQGKATVFAGVTGELNAYGLAGPYFKAGYEWVAEVKAARGDPLAWCLHREPVAEWGTKTSDLFERLFDSSEKTTFAWDFRQTDMAGLCGGVEPPRVSTVYVPDGLTGLAYYAKLQVENGAAPLTWTATGLPPGLSLNGDSITGTPTQVGHFSPVVTVTDKYNRPSSRALVLDVRQTSAQAQALLGTLAHLSDGTSWYVDKRGGRHAVPDGGTFECLQAQGVAVSETASDVAGELPLFENAQCVRANQGDIIRTSDGDAYVLNSDWTRSWIPDGGSFTCLQANGHVLVNDVPRYYIEDHAPAANAVLSCYDAGAVRGKAIRGSDGKSWYIDERGGKHWIPDGGTFDCIAAQTGGPYPYAVPAQWLTQTQYENARCVRANQGDIIRTSDGDAYVLNTDWTRSWIPDGGSFLCLQANGHPLVNDVPRYYVDDHTPAANATLACYDANAVPGKVVRGSDGNSWYVDKRGGKHWIPDGGTFDCIAAQTGGAYAYAVPAQWLTQTQYENAQCVRANPGNVIRTSDGDAYVLNGDWTRSSIPTGGSYACFLASGRALVNGVPRYYIDDLQRVGDAVYASGQCIVRQPDGTAWQVNNEGFREWIPDSPTWDCETGRGVPVINVTAAYAAGIGEKGWHYCLNLANLRNRIVRNMDTGAAYLTYGNDTKTWIPDEFTYNCRTRQGYGVVNTHWQQYIDAFSGTTWDSCFDIETFKNKFIKMEPDGDAHFVDERGVRHWVPDSAYACMVARFGQPHITKRRNYIDAMARGDWAVCGDTLGPNQNMDRGQWLTSAGNGYTLHMQGDGNLVLYNAGGTPLWATGTGSNATKVRFDGNGALSVQDGSGNWLWSLCGSYGSNANRFVVQSDSNVVLYRDGTPLWNRFSGGHC